MTIQVTKSSSLSDIEALLHGLDGLAERDTPLRLLIGSASDGGMLADIWTAILVGTASRRRKTDVIAWGLRSAISPSSTIATTLPFLTGLSLAHEVASDSNEALDKAMARRFYATRKRGIVDQASGAEQILVEFDPDHSVAPILRGGSEFDTALPRMRTKIFEQLILRFRRRLEIGALRRGIDPVSAGPAGDLGRFLAELHENGFEHGSRDEQGRVRPGTRFMRIRKHVANSRTQLVERCGSYAPLRRYVEQSIAEHATPALVEASVSDFGLGIVDGFASSPAARGLHLDRPALLDALTNGRLSSKASDPSAGLGIQKALSAAARMQGFVSLRTAEFWKTAAFTGADPGITLEDVPGGPHPKVAGTHWQFLWPQP